MEEVLFIGNVNIGVLAMVILGSYLLGAWVWGARLVIMISAIAGFLLWNEYGTDYLITAGLGRSTDGGTLRDLPAAAQGKRGEPNGPHAREGVHRGDDAAGRALLWRGRWGWCF